MAADGEYGGQRQRRPRGDVSRTRLLDAGVEVFAGLSLDELLGEIGPRRVARHLGDVSPGAFYHHFPSRADYLAALAVHALAPARDEIAPEVASLLYEVVNLPDTDVLGHLERVCNRDFERQRTVALRATRFQMCLWAQHDDPVAREALRTLYGRITASLVPAYEGILERWGREFRPPFTAHSAAAVFTALSEGLLLRHCIDRELVEPDLFARVVQALLPTLTRPVEDDTDVADAVASMARFERGPRSRPSDPDARRRLLDATLARADAGTFAEATVEDLAADAEAPVEALYAEFQAKPGLAAAAFARFLPMLERPLRTEVEDGAPAVEIIRSHLARLADIAARHRGLTNALLDAVQAATIRYGSNIGVNDPRAVVPLPKLLAPAVRAGQEQGTVRDDFEPFELAALITNLLLLRVMTRPDEPAAQVAEIVGEIALFGIARPA